MLLDGIQHCTARFVCVRAIAKATVAGNLKYFPEIMADLRAFHVEGAKTLDARSVDDAASTWQVEKLAESGGVLSRVVCRANLGCTGLCIWDETVEKCTLAYTAVATK